MGEGESSDTKRRCGREVAGAHRSYVTHTLENETIQTPSYWDKSTKAKKATTLKVCIRTVSASS